MISELLAKRAAEILLEGQEGPWAQRVRETLSGEVGIPLKNAALEVLLSKGIEEETAKTWAKEIRDTYLRFKEDAADTDTP